MVDVRTPEGYRQRVDVVRSHSATALTNALEYEGLFLMPVWRALGRTSRKLFGRSLPKTVVISTIVVGLIAAACLVPTDFTLEGQGNLRPKIRQNVFAMLDGDVRDILVEDDSQVKKGDLLVELESDELDKEINSVHGQLERARADRDATNRELHSSRGLSAADKNQKHAHLAQLKQEIISLEEEFELLMTKKAKLEVRSPIDGQVVEWNLYERLMGRPVSQGQILMEIADPQGEWELEVRMPESRMGYISEAWTESGGKLKVDFILATHPANPLEGWVEEIDPSAEVRGDEGNTVLINVSFDQQMLRKTFPDPKIGAGVIAKVHCGRRSYAFVWLHDLMDFIRAKILFRL